MIRWTWRRVVDSLRRNTAPGPLALHSTVTRKDALGVLAAGTRLHPARRGEFFVSREIVLGFLDAARLEFLSPTTIEWTMGEDRTPPPWIEQPTPLPRTPAPRYHLLIRQPSGFFYTGPAHLGSWQTDGQNARFTLETRLPRDDWVRFGGYPHWLVEFNHAEQLLGPDDENKLESILSSAAASPHGHVTMTRYEEDSLHVFTNETRGWLMYLREPGDCGLCLVAADATDDESEQFKCDCGIDLEFPRSRTLSVEDATRVLVEFFRTGKLPESRLWEPQ